MPVITKRTSDFDGNDMDENHPDAVSVLIKGEVFYLKDMAEAKKAIVAWEADPTKIPFTVEKA